MITPLKFQELGSQLGIRLDRPYVGYKLATYRVADISTVQPTELYPNLS